MVLYASGEPHSKLRVDSPVENFSEPTSMVPFAPEMPIDQYLVDPGGVAEVPPYTLELGKRNAPPENVAIP